MLSVFLSSLVVHISKQGSRNPPRWIEIVSRLTHLYWNCVLAGLTYVWFQVMLEFFARLLFVHEDMFCKRKQLMKSSSEDPDTVHLLHESPLKSVEATGHDCHSTRTFAMEHFMQKIEDHLSHLLKLMSKVARHYDRKIKEMGNDHAITRQWKAIARVMDRLFVVIYLICIILSLWILFPVPPLAFLFGNYEGL